MARFVLGALAALAVLWAFGRVARRDLLAGERAAGKTRLVVMHWSGEGGQEEDAIVRDALAAFEARHPGVVVERINPGDAASFYTKLSTMMAAGEPPDVFYLGAERLASFAEAGLLLPLDELSAQDASEGREPLDLDAFYPATVDAFRWDGTRPGRGALLGIPKDFTTIGFYYNADLLRAAGVEPPGPEWTWDDFLHIARAVGRLPGKTGSEFVTWPMMVRLYLWTFGLDVVSEDFSRLRLGEPAVREALERLASWRHDEVGTLTSGKSKVATGATVFLTGDVGMAGPFGRWVVPSYRKIEDFEWGFAPMPRGTVRANAIATVAWAISRRTEHPREAWELVRELVSPAAQARFARLGLAIPSLRAVAESDAFLDPRVPPADDAAYLAPMDVARVVPWPADPKFEALLGSRLDEALKSGNVSVAEAIARFERDWALESTSPLARGAFPPLRWDLVAPAALVLLGVGALAGGVRWWRGRGSRLALREELAGYALVSPWLVGFAVFLAFPIALSLVLSLAKWSGVTTLDAARWVGLANYEQLLGHDQRFRTSLWVTAYYALLAVPGGQLFALLAALLLNTRVRGVAFFRAVWYLPSVLAGVGVSILWRWVFDGDNGLLNALLTPVLEPFGLRAPEWFGADAALFGPPAFALMSLWMVGGSMMVYLAGLRGIPGELYEAAALDGAGAWGRFRAVTLPMLSPVILFNGIMAVIGSFQVFTQAFVMTGGEPGDLTRFYVLYLYDQAFQFYAMGYASAMAWLLLLITLALTLFTLRGSRRYVHYEALGG